MVMKRNAMRRNLRQSIVKSLGRYIAIAAIIALGASIFVGLRMTKADMVATGQKYTDEQNMFDLRLVTSYGWGRDQVEEISRLDGIVDAEGIFYIDLIAHMGETDADDSVYRFYTIPEKINRLSLREGRMPEAPDECLADGFRFDESVLGTQITIAENNEEDSLDAMVYKTYTVVGCVSTPLYMDMNRGNTSVGNGSISNYFFVPEEAVDADYYTEIHVTIPGDYKIYSDAYNDAMDEAGEALEPLLEPLAQERLEHVRQEAEEAYADGVEEYQDGLREYYDGKHEAYDELREAYWELMDGEQQLIDSEQMLIDGEQQIEDAKVMIQEGKVTLQQSRQTLASSKSDAYKQIAEANATLFENYQTVSQNMQQVDSGLLQISTGLIELNSGITQLESGLSQLDSGIEQMNLFISILDISIDTAQRSLDFALQQQIVDETVVAQLQAKLDEYAAKQAEYHTQLEELNAQRAEYAGQLDELYKKRSELEAQQAELEANKALLENAMTSIEEGYLELAANQVMMENQFASAEAQIEAGEAKLEASEQELVNQEKRIEDGWADLEEGKQELADGWEEYRKGRDEAEAELADAKQKLADAKVELADARETIDGMTENALHVLDRNTNVGYASLDSSSDIVAGVSKVFPAFFLLVAALVCITTMTRMVDEERTQIGTLKALGYSNNEIISKYMIYAGSSAILGCGLGVLMGSVVFPVILWEAYKIMLYITDGIVLTFDWGLCLLVVFMYSAVELAVTWYCCHRTLEEVPAELIRPKAPAAGKQLLFEKLPFWKRVSFLNKVTIRNIFRYRQRLAMMMVGIGGCTALLLTGFGLRDTIVNIVDFQFEEVTTYDMSVYFADGQTEEEQQKFREKMEPYVKNIMFYHQTSVEVDFDNQVREIYMISAEDEIDNFVQFHSGKQKVELPEKNELVLSVGVAEAMGISVGDEVQLRDSDMRTLKLTVSGIYENYVYNYAVVAPETIAEQWGAEPEQQMAFIKVADGKDSHAVSAAVTNQDDVLNVSVSEDLAYMVRNMMEALDLVVWVIVFCAGLLAATVLYNLTNININERIREISTIKVLGFNSMETAMYVFKENLSLSVMGAVAGLALGKLLLDFVISQIKIDFVWFQARALPPSYLWAIILTILTAVIVDFIFYFKLEKINMAEALKSVE